MLQADVREERLQPRLARARSPEQAARAAAAALREQRQRQGDAHVPEVLADLLASGYTAGLTIEPHVAKIVHLGAGVARRADF